MSSIRRHLTATLCLAAAVLLPLGGFTIYFTVRHILLSQFDETLAAKADALLTTAEIDDGEFEIDLDVQRFAGFGSAFDGDYFEVRGSDGHIVARSPSLQRRHLNWPPSVVLDKDWKGAITIPDGKPGRAIIHHFTPTQGKKKKVFGPCQLLVASDSTELLRTLRSLMAVLLVTGAIGIIVSIALLHTALRRGFRPLDNLAAEVHDLKVDETGLRLKTDHLPEELRGIGGKLNALLDRVETSLARERSFSSHAAHELRTPLAELRSMTELIGQWPDEATPERSAEMLGALGDLEALVEKLSLLTRADAGALHVQQKPVDLEASVAQAVAKLRPAAEKRGIDVRSIVEPGNFETDPVLWQSILNNLIGNAVAHSPARAIVRVRASPSSLCVINAAPNVTAEDVPMLFRRFWRKNTARAGDHHSGLGLAIVEASVSLLGGTCHASLSEAGELQVQVNWKVS